jgi:hypothetical protein
VEAAPVTVSAADYQQMLGAKDDPYRLEDDVSTRIKRLRVRPETTDSPQLGPAERLQRTAEEFWFRSFGAETTAPWAKFKAFVLGNSREQEVQLGDLKEMFCVRGKWD